MSASENSNGWEARERLSSFAAIASQTPPIETSSMNARLRSDLSPFMATNQAFVNSPLFSEGQPMSPLCMIRHSRSPGTSLRRNLARSNALQSITRAESSSSSNLGDGSEDLKSSSANARRASSESENDADDGNASSDRQGRKTKVRRISGHGASASSQPSGASSSAAVPTASAATANPHGTRGSMKSKQRASGKSSSKNPSGATYDIPAAPRTTNGPRTKSLKNMVTNMAESGRRSQNRGQWTPEEDKRLIALVRENGANGWTQIAADLNTGRNGRQCRERWSNQINPNLVRAKWSKEEDEVILRAHSEVGNRWATIAKLLPGRTDNMVKNRFNGSLLPKQVRKARESGEEPTILKKSKEPVPRNPDRKKKIEFSDETLALANQLQEMERSAPLLKASTRGLPPSGGSGSNLNSGSPSADSDDGNDGHLTRTASGSSAGVSSITSSNAGKLPKSDAPISAPIRRPAVPSCVPGSMAQPTSTSKPKPRVGGSAFSTASINSSGRSSSSSSSSDRSESAGPKRGIKRRPTKQHSDSMTSDMAYNDDVMSRVTKELPNTSSAAYNPASFFFDSRSTVNDLETPKSPPERFSGLFNASPGSLANATPGQTFGLDMSETFVGSSRELFKGNNDVPPSPMINFNLFASPVIKFSESPAPTQQMLRENITNMPAKRRLNLLFADNMDAIADSDKSKRLVPGQQSPAPDDPFSRSSLSTPRASSSREFASTPMTVSSDFENVFLNSLAKGGDMEDFIHQLALSSVKRSPNGPDAMKGLRDPSGVRRALDGSSPEATPLSKFGKDTPQELAKLRSHKLDLLSSPSKTAISSNNTGNTLSQLANSSFLNGPVRLGESRYSKVTSTGSTSGNPGNGYEAGSQDQHLNAFTALKSEDVEHPSKKLQVLEPAAQSIHSPNNDEDHDDNKINKNHDHDNEDHDEDDEKKSDRPGSSQLTDDAGAAETCSRSSASSPEPLDSTHTGKEVWEVSNDLPCKCRRSKCLKLYCTCFAGEMHCGDLCLCLNCSNRPNNDRWRKAAQFASEKKVSEASPIQCRCRNSQCLKKYCDCFRASVKCGSICKCTDCHNTEAGQHLLDRTDAASLESSCTEDSNSREALESFRKQTTPLSADRDFATKNLAMLAYESPRGTAMTGI